MNILRYKIIYVVILLMFLTSCQAEKIRAQSEADKTKIEAQQYALTQEQQRQQVADLHNIQMQEAAREQARKDAIEQDVTRAWQLFVQVVSLVLIAAAIYAVIVGTRATTTAYQTAVIGIGEAIGEAAKLRARLIYLDDGRQFPAMVDDHMITDITTGATVPTNEVHPGNPQQIAGAIANRHVGIVAKETRRSGPDTAPSTALAQNPPIVEAKFSDVKEYYEMVIKQKKEVDNE